MAKDIASVRFNEKIKRISTVVANAGLALLAAGAAQFWQKGVDVELYPVVWIVAGIGIIYIAWILNDALEPEDD